MKLFILALMASTTMVSAAHSPSYWHEELIPSRGEIGAQIDARCSEHYAKGWYNMGLDDQTYYIFFCKPRGWA